MNNTLKRGLGGWGQESMGVHRGTDGLCKDIHGGASDLG